MGSWWTFFLWWFGNGFLYKIHIVLVSTVHRDPKYEAENPVLIAFEQPASAPKQVVWDVRNCCHPWCEPCKPHTCIRKYDFVVKIGTIKYQSCLGMINIYYQPCRANHHSVHTGLAKGLSNKRSQNANMTGTSTAPNKCPPHSLEIKSLKPPS